MIEQIGYENFMSTKKVFKFHIHILFKISLQKHLPFINSDFV